MKYRYLLVFVVMTVEGKTVTTNRVEEYDEMITTEKQIREIEALAKKIGGAKVYDVTLINIIPLCKI